MKKFALFILLALVALTSAGIVVAQDDVPGFDTNTPVTPVSTVAADEPIIAATEEPVSSPVGENDAPLSDGEIRLSWAQLIFGLLTTIGMSLLAGGGLTFAAIRGIVSQVKSNLDTKDLIEKLYNSAPLERRLIIREVVETAKDVVDIADQVTDGKPNAAAPASG